MNATAEHEEVVNPVIRVSTETRLKLDEIAAHGRWNIRTTVDVLADLYIEQNGLRPKRDRRSTSRRRSPSA